MPSLVTEKLVDDHPLTKEEVVDICLSCWESLFESKIGTDGWVIGRDILLTPQTMGNLFHTLFQKEITTRYPTLWRPERDNSDKDVVNIKNISHSFEIKTSSHKNKVFGNRSFTKTRRTQKKDKTGYYLLVNYEHQKRVEPGQKPEITLIRFGWLDQTEWMGQIASSGQQSTLSKETLDSAFVVLYTKENQSKA